MKQVKLILSVIILIAISVLSFKIIQLSKDNQKYKHYYAEINHFKYGLFSVDTWKSKLSVIISEEIDELYLTRQNKKEIKKHLEKQLGVLIDKMIQKMKEENYKTTEGWLKQGFIDSFINVAEIKKGIPEYADAIMKEMSSSKTEAQIKGMLKEKIDSYMQETFDIREDNLKTAIIARSGAYTEAEAKKIIRDKIADNNQIISKFSLYLGILACFLFVMEGFSKGALRQAHYFILIFSLLMLLSVGVTTPMIDMEAKISKLAFMLFDHPIEFEDQILYFQTKSILDVFWIMITHKEFQMKLVGILMVCFSVIFPVFKMLSSIAYYYDYCQARKYKIVQFFVLKSGKWSMADVLVVAIFMAYIGFNGIINSQLDDLKAEAQGLEILTTNGTNLQPGFYVFLTYTILAMFLSGFLKTRPYHCENTG